LWDKPFLQTPGSSFGIKTITAEAALPVTQNPCWQKVGMSERVR